MKCTECDTNCKRIRQTETTWLHVCPSCFNDFVRVITTRQLAKLAATDRTTP